MRRHLALLMLTAALGLVPLAPAQAATTVSISASRTTLLLGQQSTFSGKATGAEPLSPVRLQRKISGTWRTVASSHLSATRTYRFTVKPAKGFHDFRVLRPAQSGQPAATSGVVRLAVQWRPVLTALLSDTVDETTGEVTSTVTGHATGLVAGDHVLRDVLLPGGSWSTQASVPIDASLNWSDSFACVNDEIIRYVVPASGLRLAATSPVQTVDGHWTPSLTATALMDPVQETATATGLVQGVPPGTQLLLERFDEGWQNWQVVGDTLVGDDLTFTDSFPASYVRQYRYTAPMDGLRESAASPPFTVGEGVPGYIPLNATTTVKIPQGGVLRTVLIHLVAGQRFSVFRNGGSTISMSDPTGTPVAAVTPQANPVTTVAPVTGDYQVTVGYQAPVSPAQAVFLTISTPIVLDLTLDADGIPVDGQLPGQVVDLTFDPSGSQVVSEYGAHGYWESMTMLDPHGIPVPNYGWLQREGTVWKLPATSGSYTLRIVNFSLSGDLIHHPSVSLLSARTGQLSLDGGPVHVDLDRPGRVAALEVAVPAGLDVLLSDTGSPYSLEDIVAPDGTRVENNDTQQTIVPTQAGTYTLLTSVTGNAIPAGMDYYASTPVDYAINVGGDQVPYDQGQAPGRAAVVHVTGDPGQTFSYTAYDATGVPCRSPLVHSLPDSGTLDLRTSMCAAQGTIQVLPTAVATFDPSTSTATLTITQPGQVAIIDYDTGTHANNVIELKSVGSTFPAGTKYWFGLRGVPDGSGQDTIDVAASYLTGTEQWFLWAGPTATGSVDVQFTQTFH